MYLLIVVGELLKNVVGFHLSTVDNGMWYTSRVRCQNVTNTTCLFNMSVKDFAYMANNVISQRHVCAHFSDETAKTLQTLDAQFVLKRFLALLHQCHR